MQDYDKINVISDYQVLLEDDFPILFVGKNKFGEWIIGSFISDEEENKEVLYFYNIVSESILNSFNDNKISYLEVMKNAKQIFIVEKSMIDTIINKQECLFENIELSFLPLKDSFLPDNIQISNFCDKNKNKSIYLPFKLLDSNMNNLYEINYQNIEINKPIQNFVINSNYSYAY